MSGLRGTLDAGMTGVVLIGSVAVLLGLAAVIRPSLDGDDAAAATRDALERIAMIYGTDVRPALPDGKTWLHGGGRFPEGVSSATSWPLQRWLLDRDAAPDEGLPSDGWGHTIMLIPGSFQGRHVVMIVSAGGDGRLQSSPEAGVRGDDMARIIG